MQGQAPKCPKCEQPVVDTATFCSACGQRMSEKDILDPHPGSDGSPNGLSLSDSSRGKSALIANTVITLGVLSVSIWTITAVRILYLPTEFLFAQLTNSPRDYLYLESGKFVRLDSITSLMTAFQADTADLARSNYVLIAVTTGLLTAVAGISLGIANKLRQRRRSKGSHPQGTAGLWLSLGALGLFAISAGPLAIGLQSEAAFNSPSATEERSTITPSPPTDSSVSDGDDDVYAGEFNMDAYVALITYWDFVATGTEQQNACSMFTPSSPVFQPDRAISELFSGLNFYLDRNGFSTVDRDGFRAVWERVYGERCNGRYPCDPDPDNDDEFGNRISCRYL